MKILSVAGIVVLLFMFSFLGERPETTVAPSEEPSVMPTGRSYSNEYGYVAFSSEEEFIAYVREFQNNPQNAFVGNEDDEYNEFRGEYGLTMFTHYYKLKNPPTNAKIRVIFPTANSLVTIIYDTQMPDPEGEHMMIQYGPHLSFDIATKSSWPDRPFPEESYIREIDGVTYYIAKWNSFGSIFLWAVYWINADGYHMTAEFPYRFTADEVLAYVSDLERVEIG